MVDEYVIRFRRDLLVYNNVRLPWWCWLFEMMTIVSELSAISRWGRRYLSSNEFRSIQSIDRKNMSVAESDKLICYANWL